MISFATATRRLLVGAVVSLASSSAFAATYNVSLFQGATGTGSGSFTFTNAGSSGTASVSLATNASSSAGAQSFNAANLNVQVFQVTFNDNKTPPNSITGNFVEGLTGSLSTTPVAGVLGCNRQQTCFYRITFSFTGNANPNNASKTYRIDVVRTQGNDILSTPVPLGTYAVANTATIPEPGSLALIALGLIALAWHQVRLRRRRAG